MVVPVSLRDAAVWFYCRRPSGDEVMTGLNHNLITQRFKLNNKVALITGVCACLSVCLFASSVNPCKAMKLGVCARL